MSDKKQVLVVGGSGFLGSHVADQLSQNGYQVKIFDTRKSKYLRSDQEMFIGDILDRDTILKAATGCNYIYNFAGIADIHEAHENPVLTNKLNVLGNTHVLDVARELNIKRYIFASTVYVYSNLGSFYRVSKQASEKFIEAYYDAYGLEFTILRYGSLYGRRADERNGIYRFVKEALLRNRITYQGSKNATREYIHVEDAAKLSVEVLAEKFSNKHLILTGQEKMKIDNLFSMIAEMLPGHVAIDYPGEKEDGHYQFTPYKFQPSLGEKLVSTSYTDLGQGILDTMAEIYEENPKVKPPIKSEAFS